MQEALGRTELPRYRYPSDTTEERKAYHRDCYYRSRYGLTTEQRERIFSASDGACQVCWEREAQVLDHDHDTGKARGAVCRRCNRDLAVLDEGRLEQLMEYRARGPWQD